VAPEPIRERDLTRTRTQLQRQMTQHENRIGKALEDANIKLASVVLDLLCMNSRRILEALVTGETDPARLAALADRRLKASPEELAVTLDGRFTRHYAVLVREHLTMFDVLAQQIARFEMEVEALLAPFRQFVAERTKIPGVRKRAVCAILAEIGLDIGCFASAGHLLSWAHAGRGCLQTEPTDRCPWCGPRPWRIAPAAARAQKAQRLAGQIRALGFAVELSRAARPCTASDLSVSGKVLSE
jgi:transposase